MRLSFTKTLIWSTLVVLVLAVALALWFFATPAQSAAADIDLQISGLSSKTGKQYGDLFDAAIDADGKIYGKIENWIFKAGEGTEYYILAKDFRVSPTASGYTDSTKRLCDEHGLVKVDVLADYDPANGSTGKYYLTYEDSGYITFFEKLQVYITETGEPYPNYYVATNKVNELVYCQVIPREITVAYNASDSHVGGGTEGDSLPTTEKDGVLYIDHTYGALPDTIAFAEKADSAKVMTAEFDDVLTTSTTFEGNDRTTHVGYYEIASLDLKVMRSGVDVSHNYHFTSELEYVGADSATYTGYGVRVVPRVIEIADFCRDDSKFATKRNAYEGLYDGTQFIAGTFSSQGFSSDVGELISGVSNQTVTVYYDVVPDQEGLWDRDNHGNDREGVVAITEAEQAWALCIVGWTVSTTEPNYTPSGADYLVRPQLGAAFTLKVGKRSIVLYEHSSGMEDKPDNWVDVVSNHIAISMPYGYAYTGDKENHQITIDNIPVTLSFEVQYEGAALADYLVAHSLDSIILPAGTYNIINPEVTDVHYDVAVDESVHWTVTKKVIAYDDLVRWGITDGTYVAASNGSADAKAMHAYLAAYAESTAGVCLAEYAYDADRTEIALEHTFLDKDIAEDCAVQVNMAVEAGLPGYYALTFTHPDYEVAAGTLYVRVKPVTVTVTTPVDAIYRGASFAAIPYFDGADTSPFAEWSVGLTYRIGTRTVAPLNAGTYTVLVAVNGPEGSAANPYLVYNGTVEHFTISPKAIDVRLKSNAQLTKTFGDSVAKRKLTFDADNLVGADSLSLDSAGLAEDAAPGTYPITVSLDKGESANYTITLYDSSNRRNPRFTVEKITVDSVLAYFESLLMEGTVTTTTSSISLPNIHYYGIALDGVGYQYAVGDGVWTDTSASINGLSEGTRYRVQVVISPDSSFIDTDVDVCTSARIIYTEVVRPELEQDAVLSSSRSVVVRVTNVERTKTYRVVAYPATMADTPVDDIPANVKDKAVNVTPDEDGVFNVARCYSLKEGADGLLLDQLSEMSADGAYHLVLVVKVADSEVICEPFTVRTRPAAPTLPASSFTVSASSITVPEGYYVYVAEAESNAALPVSSVVEVSMQNAGITYALLAESGAELTEEYVQSVAEGLQANKTYVIAIWRLEEGSALASDVQCFTFHTQIDKTNRFSYTGAMLVISRYLMVGLTGLIVLLFIICTIRFAVLRKKLSGGNR